MRWPHASLTKEEVEFLREAYKNHQSPTEIYQNRYEDKMQWQSFMNIWTDKRYSSVMSEVFNNKTKRKTKLTIEKVKKIMELRESKNLSYDKLAEMFDISSSTIADIVRKRTWKNV